MIVRGRGCSKMPCESCAVQFSVFRRKRACSECERYYCAGCLRRGGGAMCAPCRALSTRPLARPAIAHLKVRDLQCFLQRQNVSTRGCVEKEELVSLCVAHVNSAAYRRRAPRAQAFPSLKGITSNINDFLNSTFDLRQPPQPRPAQPPPNTNRASGCHNSAHEHAHTQTQAQAPRRERFTPTPGGQERISVPVPEPGGGGGAAGAPLVDTADCLEVEDLDDQGWELVRRPADPLPNDSDVLLSSPIADSMPTTPMRASSSLELRSPTSESPEPDSASLQDEPIDAHTHSAHSAHAQCPGRPPTPPPRPPHTLSADEHEPDTNAPPLRVGSLCSRTMCVLGLIAASTRPRSPDTVTLVDAPPSPPPRPPHTLNTPDDANGVSQLVALEDLKDMTELEGLSVRQLKQLLARNRVEFRGCVERQELLARAQRLYRDHAKYRDELEALPLEECCKICMAAPLECVLLECGHIAACTRCAKQLAECPICRQYVVRAVRFFRS